MREIIKGGGLHGGSSHSGRRSLATWLDWAGRDLDLIQDLLNHLDPDMTIEYIEPCPPRIEKAYRNIWKGVKMPKILK